MKKLISLILITAVLFVLCACGAKTENKEPEAALEQEQQVTPEPKEEEPIKELPVEEAYQCSVLIENRRYDMEARFFPQCGMCRITSMQGDTEVTLYEGPYTEEDGMYTIDMNGETVCLRLGEGSLTVEKGALIA